MKSSLNLLALLFVVALVLIATGVKILGALAMLMMLICGTVLCIDTYNGSPLSKEIWDDIVCLFESIRRRV